MTAHTALSHPDPKVHARRWWILTILSLSVFLVVVDNLIINVAIPTLARELEATTSGLQWIVDSYALVFAGLLLACGGLGDRFGRKDDAQNLANHIGKIVRIEPDGRVPADNPFMNSEMVEAPAKWTDEDKSRYNKIILMWVAGFAAVALIRYKAKGKKPWEL